MGPVLGWAIRESRLCRGQYRIGADVIRATVIGAGCHSAQLSGSTIFCQNVELPLKNLPVVFPEAGLPLGAAIARAVKSREEIPVIALPGLDAPGYAQVVQMAEEIAGAGVEPLILCLEADMAKALGQALAVRLGKDAKILCIDRVKLRGEAYLDVGKAVGPALPVVVKTIVLAS
jgi:ethanolamine utilization protein EutA